MKTNLLKTLAFSLVLLALVCAVVIPQEAPQAIPILMKASVEEITPKREPPIPFRNRVKFAKSLKLPSSVDMEDLSPKVSRLRPNKDGWEAALPAEAKLRVTGWHTGILSVEKKDRYTEVTANVVPQVASDLGGSWSIGGKAIAVYRVYEDGKITQVEWTFPETKDIAIANF